MDRPVVSRRRFLQTAGALAATASLATPTAADPTPNPPAPPAARAGAIPAAATAAGVPKVRFGVTAPQGQRFEEIVRFWQEADTLGYDSAWVYDHFMGAAPGPIADERCLESWTLLSALAARTTKVRVGVLVTGNTYRHPAVLAKMAATVDHVSGGRLILGLGAAWLEREHLAYGIPFYTPGERAHRLAEAVEVIVRLFTEERASFTGRFYSLQDAPCEPKPLQRPHPPILIGGLGGKVVQPLAARHAQIWHFLLPNADAPAIRKLCDDFDALCRAAGRDPASVEKATSLDPKALFASGPPLADRVAALVGAGVRHFMLLPPPPGDLSLIQRFAREVIPAVRKAVG